MPVEFQFAFLSESTKHCKTIRGLLSRGIADEAERRRTPNSIRASILRDERLEFRDKKERRADEIYYIYIYMY